MQTTAARQFLKRLFSELWSQPDPVKVEEFYHSDVVGYFGAQQINIDDIKNRASFSRQVYANINTEILDVIVEGNQIATRLKQTAVRKDGADALIHHPIAIYHLRDNKISKLWFLTDNPFDYKEVG